MEQLQGRDSLNNFHFSGWTGFKSFLRFIDPVSQA